MASIIAMFHRSFGFDSPTMGHSSSIVLNLYIYLTFFFLLSVSTVTISLFSSRFCLLVKCSMFAWAHYSLLVFRSWRFFIGIDVWSSEDETCFWSGYFPCIQNFSSFIRISATRCWSILWLTTRWFRLECFYHFFQRTNRTVHFDIETRCTIRNLNSFQQQRQTTPRNLCASTVVFET